MRSFQDLPTAQGVAPGSTAVVNCPVGLTYYHLVFHYSRGDPLAKATPAEFAADVAQMRLKVDGETFVTLTGPEWLMLLNFYGVPVLDGLFVFPFARPWMRQAVTEDALALGTADIVTFTVEIDFAATAVAPSLRVEAWQGPPTPMGEHVEIKRFPQTYAGSGGEFEIPDLTKTDRHATVAFHLGTANISQLTVSANQRDLLDQITKDALDQMYRFTAHPRVWQTGWWHVDFHHLNRFTDALPMAWQDFRLKLTMSDAAPSFMLVQERIVRRATA